MTELQKKIYNDYLKALAKANNRPYKFRKDFSEIDNDTKNVLYRLELFFLKFKHIEPFKFFEATFEYKGLKFAKLEDFLRHNAIIAYSKWSNAKYNVSIESEKAIEDFMSGLKFIYDYCVSEGITLKDYRTKTNNIGVLQMLIHLNEQKISYYHLHALNVNRSQLDSDYLQIMFKDFDKMFEETKRQYNNSKIIKLITNKLKIQ